MHAKLNVNAKCGNGRTALYMASYRGDCDVVRELMKHDNLDVNVATLPSSGPRLLGNHLDVVGELLQHDKLDINAKNLAGSTALDIARNCEMFDIMNCLEGHIKCISNRQWVRSTAEAI
ncbi:hypothetical protein MHU86_13120 [Fragilaria crotonensis]|nr:hypothetical protein MHU86_13120 [Fragilaria crotonensis]